MRISKEAKTGIITIFVLALAFWGYHFLKGQNILNPTDEYFVEFDRVDGIIESGNVYMRGFKVGNITHITFDHGKSNKFFVRIIMNDGIQIPKNSKIKTKQTSLVASAVDLEIIASEETNFCSMGDTLQSIPTKGMAELLTPLQKRMESVLDGLDSTLTSVNQILTLKFEDDLQLGLEQLAQTLSKLNYSLSANGSLGGTFNNIESITGNLKSSNQKITDMLTNLSNITAALDSANLSGTLVKLDSTLTSTQEIMSKINHSEGTLGLMINDSSLYMHLDSSVAQVNSLLIDLQAHPKRYVHLSVFGKKDK